MYCPCIILKLTSSFLYTNVVTHHVIILKLTRMIMCCPCIILKNRYQFYLFFLPKKKKKNHYLCQDITRHNDTIF